MGRDIRNDVESTERRLASRELGKARRSIDAIRSFYLANIILCGVILLFVWLGEASGLTIGVAALATGAMVAGFMQIRTRPFVWSLIIACVWTVLMALMGNAGLLMPPNLLTFLGGAWTLGCWMMLPTTTRVNKLLAEHPDLWISKKMTGGAKRRPRRR
ncbi:MAG: hypothetical protein ACYTEG_15280 [Planctomycetota bacterium]|jgi:hypothetical protein